MKESRKNILTAFLLNFVFAIIEFIGGIVSSSIAIMSDSIHDLGDSISIGVAYFLEKKSEKGADDKYTFGYLRFSILGAFITNMILLFGAGFMIYESIKRFMNPVMVNGWIMFALAILGMIVNVFAVLKTRKGKGLNEKSISLHMLEDVMGWVVVLIGSIAMLIVNLPYIDSVLSLLVSAYILYHVVKNFIVITNILMQKAPKNFDVEEYRNHLLSVKNVEDIHHLHVWTLDGENIFASFHAKVNCENIDDIIKVKDSLKEESIEHNVKHLTIQTEFKNEKCDEPDCHIQSSGENHLGHNHNH